MNTLLTVLQAVPPPHSQIETGKPGPAGSPSAQTDTRCPTGRTGIKIYTIYDGQKKANLENFSIPSLWL